MFGCNMSSKFRFVVVEDKVVIESECKLVLERVNLAFVEFVLIDSTIRL